MRRFDITCIHPGGVSSQPSLKTQVEKAEGYRQTLARACFLCTADQVNAHFRVIKTERSAVSKKPFSLTGFRSNCH